MSTLMIGIDPGWVDIGMFLCHKEDLENISFHQLNLLEDSGINYTSKDILRKKQKNGLSSFTPEEKSKMFMVLISRIMVTTGNLDGYTKIEVYIEKQGSKFGKRSSSWSSYLQDGFYTIFKYLKMRVKVKQMNTYTMKNKLKIPIHINNRNLNKIESVKWYTENMPWGNKTDDVKPEYLTHDQIEASLYVYVNLIKKSKR